MNQVKNALVIIEAALALLLSIGVLVQTPKASGLGGTIGGGDGGLGGGYRTGREVAAFLVSSIANIWVRAHYP